MTHRSIAPAVLTQQVSTFAFVEAALQLSAESSGQVGAARETSSNRLEEEGEVETNASAVGRARRKNEESIQEMWRRQRVVARKSSVDEVRGQFRRLAGSPNLPRIEQHVLGGEDPFSVVLRRDPRRKRNKKSLIDKGMRFQFECRERSRDAA